MLTSHFYPVSYSPKKSNTSSRKFKLSEYLNERIRGSSVKRNNSFEVGNKNSYLRLQGSSATLLEALKKVDTKDKEQDRQRDRDNKRNRERERDREERLPCNTSINSIRNSLISGRKRNPLSMFCPETKSPKEREKDKLNFVNDLIQRRYQIRLRNNVLFRARETSFKASRSEMKRPVQNMDGDPFMGWQVQEDFM